jgi:methyl-accepting chemotaxis protein
MSCETGTFAWQVHSWAGLVNSEDLSAAWNAITGFVSGTASKVWDGITSIEWSGLVDSEAMSRAIDSLVGIVERGWETLEGIFDSIIAAAAAVGEKVGEAITIAIDGARAALAALSGDRGVERIFGQLDALAENGIGRDFVQGQALTEALEAEQITLDAYRQALAAVVEEGGRFAEIAQQMIDKSGQLDTFSLPEPPAPQMPPMEDIDAVSAKLSAIQAAAAETIAAVQSAISQIVGIVQSTDLTAEGARIAASIAAGIRAQIGEVRAQIGEVRAQIGEVRAQIGEVRAAAAAMSAAIRSALPRQR